MITFFWGLIVTKICLNEILQDKIEFRNIRVHNRWLTKKDININLKDAKPHTKWTRSLKSAWQEGRDWLQFKDIINKMFCSTCLEYQAKVNNINFIQGCTISKLESVKSLEISTFHKSSLEIQAAKINVVWNLGQLSSNLASEDFMVTGQCPYFPYATVCKASHHIPQD